MTQQPPSSCVVFTSPSLARAVVRTLSRNNPLNWLEPSCGEGAFLDAIAAEGVPAPRIVGIDIQPRRSTSDSLATVKRGVDFLDWASKTQLRFDAVVGNPPYVRISSLPSPLRRSALSVVGPDGTSVTAGANAWAAFVLASTTLLNRNGCLAFVLPAAFQYANYAQPVWKTLLSAFGRVVAYRSEKPLFDNVKDGAVVLVASNRGQTSSHIEYHEFKDRASLIETLTAGERPSVRAVCIKSHLDSEAGMSRIALGQIVKLGIGAVTGHSADFLMTDKERRGRDIPVKACVPVLSRTCQLCNAHIDSAVWQKLRDAGQRVWLFRPSPAQCRRGAVARYIREGQVARAAYKVSLRKPWYRTPLPKSAEVFLSGQWQTGPWLAINVMKRLSATNTLYVGRFWRKGMSLDEKSAWGLSVMSSTSLESWKLLRRRYPDGLLKCEPGDLVQLLIPTIPQDVQGAALTYRCAVDLFIRGNTEQARILADAWLNGQLTTTSSSARRARGSLRRDQLVIGVHSR